jgi:hypothetical protein
MIGWVMSSGKYIMHIQDEKNSFRKIIKLKRGRNDANGAKKINCNLKSMESWIRTKQN